MLQTSESFNLKPSATLKKSSVAEIDDILCHLAFNNSIQANIITTVFSGQIVVTNGAACKLLGYTKKELLNRNESDIFDVDETAFKKMLKQRAAKGKSTAIVTCIKKTGKTFPCEITSAVFMNEDGVEAAVITIADISQKIREQEAFNSELQKANRELMDSGEELQSLNEELETSKEKLQNINEKLVSLNLELSERDEQHDQARLYAEAIITTLHEPLLVLNRDFRVKSANESFYKTFLLTPGKVIGSILFELENNGWNIPGLSDKLLQIQTEKEKFLEWEDTCIFPLAGKRTICIKAKPFQRANGESQILLAFDDITLRKEKENAEKKNSEDLIRLLENIPQITLTTSAEGTITYFNKFFLNYSGMSFEKALRKGWDPLIRPELRDEIKKLWKAEIAAGKDFQMELQLKKKSENMYRWHLYKASPIRNDEGIIISWVGAATDFHDQKIREQAQDEFMSVASHELKTPLTTAKAYVQLLEFSLDQTNNKDLMFARKAGESIDRLGNLISELLDVSKIRNGKLTLNITTFNFNEMISNAIEGFQYTSPTHKIIKKGEISREIRGDKERLQQVVVNLLDNAIKYSPTANKVIVNMVSKKGEIIVSVKDRGIGIDKENLWKIFERYYREEDRTIHFQGLGIGLYISYDIIQRHHGKLWAQRNIGKGSTFYFTIPI